MCSESTWEWQKEWGTVMIIVRLSGGLGNQMFQYAAARRLACKHNTIPKLDIIPLIEGGYRSYRLQCFNIQEYFVDSMDVFRVYPIEGLKRMASNVVGKKISNLFFRKVIRDKNRVLAQRYYDYDSTSSNVADLVVGRIVSQRFFHFDPEMLQAPDDVYLMGSWISEKYFKDIEDIIRKEFTIKTAQTGKNKEIAEMILNTESVSLHVRRGDYVTGPSNPELYDICKLDYYARYIEYIGDRIKSPHFFVFSDDVLWVKENLKSSFPLNFVNHNDDSTDYEDMRLISQCKHNIIANSSFSWWGAWLNTNLQKIVCAPREFVRICNFDNKDIVPDEWVKLSCR